MKKELPYFMIGTMYGADQERYDDAVMNMGGCAATVACETCVYLKKYRGMANLTSLDPDALTWEEYQAFSLKMKPYLHPRLTGINKLSMYIDGFSNYLKDAGEENLLMKPYEATHETTEAFSVLTKQIDAGLPVPFLLLRHKDPQFEDFIWHWFLLTGYDIPDVGSPRVKVVSYGEWVWLDFEKLWNTGFTTVGGMILYSNAK